MLSDRKKNWLSFQWHRNVIYQPKSPAQSPNLYLSFHCRVGYLTLFGEEQNNNSTDPSSVYEEYKKFDGLLTKMARGTLKAGNDIGDKLTAEFTYCYLKAL